MKYIDTWLSGLGLDYVIPKLKINGITTPKKLATLSLREIYEVVGVEDSEDRKKLFFLIQRLQTILQHKTETDAAVSNGYPLSDHEAVLEKALCISVDDAQSRNNKEVDDLRLLRLNRRQSASTSLTALPPNNSLGTAVVKVCASNSLENLRDNFGSTSGPEPKTTISASPEDLAIRVVVRKRPLSRAEISRAERDVVEIRKVGTVLVHEPKTKVDLTKIVETQTFTFDDAFDQNETNEEIYNRTVQPLIAFIFNGGKATCFAYGQTGSGKTFTTMGSRPGYPSDITVNSGLYVLAASEIISSIKRTKTFNKLRVFVSCFEIYGGKLYDLLHSRNAVKCLEDAKQRVQIVGLTEHKVQTVEDILTLMASAHANRSTGSTGANAESSRSHQVLQICLKNSPEDKLERKLSFIDLAGSERGADTTHSSKQTRLEGAEINTSLLALKEVIRSLEKKNSFTPFRGSKLTQVLKDSFVGDRTRTCMIACISPSHVNCEHTLNTLRYADRVKEHQAAENPAQETIFPAKPQDAGFNQKEVVRFQINHAQKENSKSSNESLLPESSEKVKQKSSVSRSTPLRQREGTVSNETHLELIQRTVGLLSAHKLAIAEMVEVMKDEMELVQGMENVDDRNTDSYVDRLENILRVKSDAISALKNELHSFLSFRCVK